MTHPAKQRAEPLVTGDRVKLPRLADCRCGACLFAELFFDAGLESAVLTERCGDLLIYRTTALEYAPTAEELERMKLEIRTNPERHLEVDREAWGERDGIKIVPDMRPERRGGLHG